MTKPDQNVDDLINALCAVKFNENVSHQSIEMAARGIAAIAKIMKIEATADTLRHAITITAAQTIASLLKAMREVGIPKQSCAAFLGMILSEITACANTAINGGGIEVIPMQSDYDFRTKLKGNAS